VSTAPLTLIVTNARIATGDPARPWATALGLRGDVLAVVASAAEILKLAGTDTTIISARGQHLELPRGTTVGSRLLASVAPDGNVQLASAEDRS
jgi:hypothetical protein